MRTTTLLRGAFLASTLAATVATAETTDSPYRTLHVDEDWSFLDADDMRGLDMFDVVKDRKLGGPWRLTFGGSTRLRFEMDDNPKLQTDPVDQDELGRMRQMLHLDISRGRMFRWFSEISAADTIGNERMASCRDENNPDVQNFFFDFTAVPTSSHPVRFRLGRQEMAFGDERLVSPDDFANVRTTFDGLRIDASTPRTNTAVFCTRPVERMDEHQLDAPSDELTFGGVYFTFDARPNHRLEGYALVLHDDEDAHVAESTGKAGDETRNTVGCRYEWGHGGWGVELEMAWQGGHSSDDGVQAGFGTANGSYTWRKASWTPKIDFGVEMATGDDDPMDGHRGTFDPMFAGSHEMLGHVGVTSRRNLQCARIGIETTPLRNLHWTSAVLCSRLDEAQDALYDETGAPLRKDVTGTAGRGVGWEAHSTVSWTFAVHHQVTLEVARFWGGDVVKSLGDRPNAAWGWVGYEFRF